MKPALTVLLLGLSLTAGAVEVGGVPLPDSWQLEGRKLPLNGAGVREYGVLGIDVYAAALYLPERNRDATAILTSAAPRVLHMHFLRSATREATLKAWEVYFAANCPPRCVLPELALARFRALIPATVAGETQTYVFQRGTVAVLRNDRPLGAIDDPLLARLLLSTWIGTAPTTEELKRALLGLPLDH